VYVQTVLTSDPLQSALYRLAQIKPRHFTFVLVTNKCIYRILWFLAHKNDIQQVFIMPIRNLADTADETIFSLQKCRKVRDFSVDF